MAEVAGEGSTSNFNEEVIRKKSCLTKTQENFGMDSVPPIYFWRSEWEEFNPIDANPKVSIRYLLYRLGHLLYFLTGLPISLTYTIELSFYLIYLTNLTFLIQLIYAAVYFGRLLYLVWKQRSKDEGEDTPLLPNSKGRLPWPEKVIWVLINLTTVVPYVVTFGYWVILYDPKKAKEGASTGGFVADLFVHLFNSVMTMVDIMVIAVPIRFTHFIFPMLYGVLYSAFSGFYELWNAKYPAGLTFIYPPLNWKLRPWIAFASATIATLAAGVLHTTMAYGLYRLRAFLCRKFGHGRNRARILSIKDSDAVIKVGPEPSASEPKKEESSSNLKEGQLEPRKKSTETVAV